MRFSLDASSAGYQIKSLGTTISLIRYTKGRPVVPGLYLSFSHTTHSFNFALNTMQYGIGRTHS